MVNSLKKLFLHLWQIFLARTLLLLVTYSVLLLTSLYLAYELRFDFVVPVDWKALRAENYLCGSLSRPPTKVFFRRLLNPLIRVRVSVGAPY